MPADRFEVHPRALQICEHNKVGSVRVSVSVCTPNTSAFALASSARKAARSYCERWWAGIAESKNTFAIFVLCE